MLYQFFGGPFDREWKDIGDSPPPEWKCYEIVSPPKYFSKHDDDVPPSCKVLRYLRRVVGGPVLLPGGEDVKWDEAYIYVLEGTPIPEE